MSALHAPGPLLHVLRIAALVLIYNEVMGGMIRYVCMRIGLPWLMYVPMILGFIAVVSCCAMLPLTRVMWAGLGVFGAYVVYSMLLALTRPGMGTGKAVACVGFAVYTWTPLFVGLLLMVHREELVLQRHAALCWGIATIGVVLNTYITFPWMGLTVEVAGQEIQVARSWTTAGISRLAGFARASYTAANEIALFSTLVIFRSTIRLRWRALIAVVSVLGIALTTSKGPLMLASLAPLVLLVMRASAATKIAALPRWVAMSTLWALMGVMVALPLILRVESVSSLDPSFLQIHSGMEFISLSSMGDRAGQMWPEAFDLIRHDHNWTEWIFGRGLGGIGSSQYYFEAARANAADNLFVFAYVTLGIGSVGIGIAMMAGFSHYYCSDRQRFLFFFALAVSVLALGVVSNVLEAAVPALSLGILIGKRLGRRPRAFGTAGAVHRGVGRPLSGGSPKAG